MHSLLAYVKEKPAIIFPVGSIEWHGPQNSIAVDTLKIKAICEDIGRQTGVVVPPPLFYGVCNTLKERTGTLSGILELTYKEYSDRSSRDFATWVFALSFVSRGIMKENKSKHCGRSRVN